MRCFNYCKKCDWCEIAIIKPHIWNHKYPFVLEDFMLRNNKNRNLWKFSKIAIINECNNFRIYSIYIHSSIFFCFFLWGSEIKGWHHYSRLFNIIPFWEYKLKTFFLKSYNFIEIKLYMNDQVSDTGSSEPLVTFFFMRIRNRIGPPLQYIV